MNIFVPFADPGSNAVALDDKRVVKMVLETAQILSTITGGPYKPTHVSHPCTLWACSSRLSFDYTCNLFDALCDEYAYRYGKVHKCRQYNWRHHRLGFADIPMLPFANCSQQNSGNVHNDYRACLALKWMNDKRMPTWTRRTMPDFLQYI